MKIFIYAFANTALFFNEVFRMSINRGDNIEWGVIYPSHNHKLRSSDILKKENIFYLYEDFNTYYSEENLKYSLSDSSANIHKMIAVSKNGYKKYDATKQEKNANTIYKLYRDFLVKNKPDCVIFPDLEVVDGAILLNLCKEMRIEVMYSVHTRLLGETIFCQDNYETLPKYYGKFNEKNLKKSRIFLDKFQDNYIKAYNSSSCNGERIKVEIPGRWLRLAKDLYYKFKHEKKGINEATYFVKLLIIFPKIHNFYRRIKFIFFQKKYFSVFNDVNKTPDNFIYFPLQMTPESSINGLEPYFVEQERLIDLIRLNMSHNFSLLVKEHPVMVGARETSFYKKNYNKTGVIFIDSRVSSFELIDKARLTVTITGTVGLEAYLSNKKIMLFGPTFFAHLCNKFDSYLKLREILQDITVNKVNRSDKEKVVQMAKIYNVSYGFELNDPMSHPNVMEIRNIVIFINSVKDHIKRLAND